MTEQEWLNTVKPIPCETIAQDFGTLRKLRLLMIGYVEMLQHLFTEDAHSVFEKLREWSDDPRVLLDGANWYGNGNALSNYMERTSAGRASSALSWIVVSGSKLEPQWEIESGIGRPGAELTDHAAQAIVLGSVGKSPPNLPITHPDFKAWDNAWQKELQAQYVIQSSLMRCVFGNPFRPVPIDPDWLTSTVVELARGMYESRDFSAMPILADALQDAGCEHPDILAHCRGGGPHVRGCWVVDLLLGKK